MIGQHYLDDDDFELDLIRDPSPSPDVPDTLRAMRARRVRVDMPTGAPSVQEVLHNPVAATTKRPALAAIRQLMRIQLRLAISLLACFFGLVVIVNLAFHFCPVLAATPLLGVPLEWLFPSVIGIPLLLALGGLYVRRATAHEGQLVRDVAEQQGPQS